MNQWALAFATVTSFLTTLPRAMAMPCDSGYACTSKSGHYSISLRRCRYHNDLRLLGVSIGGKTVDDAILGPAYDGGVLAFEIELPAVNDEQRILTVEISHHGHPGLIRERTQATNPGPFKTVASEAVTCMIAD